jgi:hypothetical protein
MASSHVGEKGTYTLVGYMTLSQTALAPAKFPALARRI